MLTFRQLCRQYTKKYLEVYRTGDIKSDLYRLQKLEDRFNSYPTGMELDSFLLTLNISPPTRNRYRALVKHMYRWAQRSELKIPPSTQTFIKLEKETNQRNQRLTIQQELDLMACLPQDMRELFVVSLYTGIRRGTLCKLTVADIDLENKSIVIPAHKNKQRKAQKVPMADIVQQIIRRKIQNIISTGEKLFVWRPYRWNCARISAGLQHYHWHDLRHEFGSRLLEKKIPLPTIQRLLGHAQITTTMRYLNATDCEAEDRAAIETL